MPPKIPQPQWILSTPHERMRRSKPALDRPYRMPLFPLPAIIALVVNATLLAAFLYESPRTVLRATALLVVVTGAVSVATR
jgi:APA family basic amino acid/polyamine antiporter